MVYTIYNTNTGRIHGYGSCSFENEIHLDENESYILESKGDGNLFYVLDGKITGCTPSPISFDISEGLITINKIPEHSNIMINGCSIEWDDELELEHDGSYNINIRIDSIEHFPIEKVILCEE